MRAASRNYSYLQFTASFDWIVVFRFCAIPSSHRVLDVLFCYEPPSHCWRLEGHCSVCSSLVVRMYIIQPGRMRHPGHGGSVQEILENSISGRLHHFQFFKSTLHCTVGCKAFLVSDFFKTELQRNENERKTNAFHITVMNAKICLHLHTQPKFLFCSIQL